MTVRPSLINEGADVLLGRLEMFASEWPSLTEGESMTIVLNVLCALSDHFARELPDRRARQKFADRLTIQVCDAIYKAAGL